MTDGEEVVRPPHQLSVLITEQRQVVTMETTTSLFYSVVADQYVLGPDNAAFKTLQEPARFLHVRLK